MQATFLRTLIGLVLASSIFSVQLGAQEKPFDIFYEKKEGGGYRLFVRSPDAIPRSVQLKFPSLQNLKPTKEAPYQFVVSEAGEKMELLDLEIIDPKKGNRFRFEYNSHLGDFKTAKHDPEAVYLMPFTHGTWHRIYQGYHGKASHFEKGMEFAIDFKMEEGTSLRAARGGTVIAVKEDSNRGGWSKSFYGHSNHVHILHEDGSIAKYEHLKQDGALVELGQKVTAGQEIGLSGNTGRSSGPHLHFEVTLPTSEGKSQSIPTKFYNHLGEVVDPEAGERYFALHPGKPKFEAKFPPDPTNADFETHKETIPKDNRISSREVEIDTTTVIYIRNGFAEAKEIEFTMPQLDNLTASKPVPLKMTVEPATERFVLFVRHKDLEQQTRWRINWTYK